jgi:hypothetical protein
MTSFHPLVFLDLFTDGTPLFALTVEPASALMTLTCKFSIITILASAKGLKAQKGADMPSQIG